MQSLFRTLCEATATPAHGLSKAFAERCILRGRAGQALHRAGDPSEEVYLLVSGYARAYIGVGSKTRTTLLMRGPTLIGDRDVIADCEAQDSVRLATPALLMTISRDDFLDEWKSAPALREWIMSDLARRYAATIRWFSLESMPLSERLRCVIPALGIAQPSSRFLASIFGVMQRSVFRSLAELRTSAEEDQESTGPLVHSLDPVLSASPKHTRRLCSTTLPL